MLSSLKDKLLKTVPLFNTNQDKQEPQSTTNININAGSDILSHFLHQWEIIHSTNEENAKVAEKVAQEIDKITEKTIKDKADISLITHIINNSNLVQNISSCTKQLGELYDLFSTVEDQLAELEDVIEQIEHESKKREHEFHLVQYKCRRNDSLLNLESNLKDEYKKTVEVFEADRKKVLEERQQVFQEAFNNDLEVFKSLGTLPKVNLPKKQTSALLEEIQLDYDERELDQFFDDK